MRKNSERCRACRQAGEVRGERTFIVKPTKSIHGEIEVPGDKSISHRALIFGSICEGKVEITNFLSAEDCLSTLECLRQLGVNISRSGTDVTVEGVGKYGFKESAEPLDVGNSGTTLRILPGLLAAQKFNTTLVGDASVSKRPMNRIIDPLSLMGAKIKSNEGHAPINIEGTGRKLSAIEYDLPVASAQVKTAVLLAGLYADGTTTVSEKIKSRDHTERMLGYLGSGIIINDNVDEHSYRVSGEASLKAKPINVPGDISSAAFFMVAAMMLENSKVLLKNCGINKSRSGILRILGNAGADIKHLNQSIDGEPTADIIVESSNLKPFSISANDIPSLVDEIPILAVLATQIKGTSTISGAGELRVKETDRLKAISTQLGLMGAKIEEKEDGLVVHGPTKLKGTIVDSGGDHRMAMSLAIAGLCAEGETIIKGAESANISFPRIFDLLEEVSR